MLFLWEVPVPINVKENRRAIKNGQSRETGTQDTERRQSKNKTTQTPPMIAGETRRRNLSSRVYVRWGYRICLSLRFFHWILELYLSFSFNILKLYHHVYLTNRLKRVARCLGYLNTWTEYQQKANPCQWCLACQR